MTKVEVTVHGGNIGLLLLLSFIYLAFYLLSTSEQIPLNVKLLSIFILLFNRYKYIYNKDLPFFLNSPLQL